MVKSVMCVSAEDRVMWYSAQYRDWDVTNGSVAQEVGCSVIFFRCCLRMQT